MIRSYYKHNFNQTCDKHYQTLIHVGLDKPGLTAKPHYLIALGSDRSLVATWLITLAGCSLNNFPQSLPRPVAFSQSTNI